jgi:hypothetical protein
VRRLLNIFDASIAANKRSKGVGIDHHLDDDDDEAFITDHERQLLDVSAMPLGPGGQLRRICGPSEAPAPHTGYVLSLARVCKVNFDWASQTLLGVQKVY